MLAAMFMTMAPMAGCPSGTDGKSRRSRGPKNRAMRSIAPPFSPRRMTPSHRHMTPVSPIAISNPVFDMSKVEVTTRDHTSASPCQSH